MHAFSYIVYIRAKHDGSEPRCVCNGEGLLDGTAHHRWKTRIAVALFSSSLISRGTARCNQQLDQSSCVGKLTSSSAADDALSFFFRATRNAVPPFAYVSKVSAIRLHDCALAVRLLQANSTDDIYIL